MLEYLFQITIFPISSAIEVLFKLFFNATNLSIIPTIILLSFIISFATLPFYCMADRRKEEIEAKQKEMEADIKNIKKNFKGNEQFFLLKTLYRQNNYHPIMTLQTSFGLLLQIPFFIAAYYFFTHLTMLRGLMSGNISDWSSPDAQFAIGNFKINVLPIAMTIVNIFAGYIYAKGKSFKENLNIYIIGLVFLILLYNSPASLVFYWLWNNIFSLIKNIVLKVTSYEKLIKYSGLLTITILYMAFVSFHIGWDLLIFFLSVLAIYKISKLKLLKFNFAPEKLYFHICTLFWLILGLLIPSTVIASDVKEFIYYDSSPIGLLIYPFCQYMGLFILWGGFIYLLLNKDLRQKISIFLLYCLVFCIVNTLTIPLPRGMLLKNLTFSSKDVLFNFQSKTAFLIHASVLAISLLILTILIFKHNIKLIKKIIISSIVGVILISGYNCVNIQKKYSILNKIPKKEIVLKRKEIYHLSKKGKNVIILFIDRAINSYFPLMLEEFPQYKNSFDGFIYYPNTVSFFSSTILGYPPILGGYEYTPLNLNKSQDVFIDKFSKSVTMLPRLFRNKNWDVSVFDTAILDDAYKDKFNTKVYKNIEYDNITSNFGDLYKKENPFNLSGYLSVKRNFYFYNLLVASCVKLREKIYNRGRYLNPNIITVKYSQELVNNYAQLHYLPQFTDFSCTNNKFIVINNKLPHQDYPLRAPKYEIDNQKQELPPDLTNDEQYVFENFYGLNVATYRMIAKYLDFLKENNAYDNSRIIIVSDHGYWTPNLKYGEFETQNIMPFNPILLVKDFNSKGKLKTSEEFMTNADVPIISTKDIFKYPKNPYTGKLLSRPDFSNGLYVYQDEFNSLHNPYRYMDKKHFLTKNDYFNKVKPGKVLNKNNWQIHINYDKLPNIAK